MKIVSPIDHRDEAAALLAAGADELYGGYVPAAWQARFGQLAPINQRTFAEAQIASHADLTEIVQQAHDNGASFSLTLNAPYYTASQLPLLLDYVDGAVTAGVDGIILADLGLLRQLSRRHPSVEFHASTLAHLLNSGAAAFYAQQGISRIVLPRHLTVAEMAEIIAENKALRYDVFMLVGKCPNTEGLCTFHHSSPDKIWPCEIPYAMAAVAPPPSPTLRQAMQRQGSWSSTNRRHGCGLCAIPGLLQMGIHGVKLVGRGAPTAQKIQNLRLVQDFMVLAKSSLTPADYRRKAMAAHHQRFASPCSPNVCYYPEFYEAE
ncbi:MAG: hypothetical protein A2091_07600 [Desulfuromonadales bacterium GWD2_61_12]|nr:MAG: hypothetical protein A2005_12430 [Desulfuromonadales bacterium GWC2_61_20]OGR33439.1 MAG: hypothetical protein A2091_07600 [Desulfuromonadales bacterium GWD2_61_12]HAD03581.1 hypothetical protein [Desulfuromonas sp.]